MLLEKIGVFLVVLVAVFAAGSLWFCFVESILKRIRGLLTRHRDPPAWHPLPPEAADRDAEDPGPPR